MVALATMLEQQPWEKAIAGLIQVQQSHQIIIGEILAMQRTHAEEMAQLRKAQSKTDSDLRDLIKALLDPKKARKSSVLL